MDAPTRQADLFSILLDVAAAMCHVPGIGKQVVTEDEERQAQDRADRASDQQPCEGKQEQARVHHVGDRLVLIVEGLPLVAVE